LKLAASSGVALALVVASSLFLSACPLPPAPVFTDGGSPDSATSLDAATDQGAPADLPVADQPSGTDGPPRDIAPPPPVDAVVIDAAAMDGPPAQDVVVIGGCPTMLTISTMQGATLDGVIDTTLHEDDPSGFHDNEDTLLVQSDPMHRTTALIRFDVSQLPAGCTVASAQVSFTVTDALDAGTTVEVYELLQPWKATQASWTSATTTMPWAYPGCDTITGGVLAQCRQATPFFTASGVPLGEWQVPIAGAMVEAWRLGSSNAGILLRLPSTDLHGLTLVSSEGQDAERPVLVVSFGL
jgi:hypothetical protein